MLLQKRTTTSFTTTARMTAQILIKIQVLTRVLLAQPAVVAVTLIHPVKRMTVPTHLLCPMRLITCPMRPHLTAQTT